MAFGKRRRVHATPGATPRREGRTEITLFGKLRGLGRDARGAVTVDWVAPTAAVVILGIGAVAAIDAGIEGLMIGMRGPLDG